MAGVAREGRAGTLGNMWDDGVPSDMAPGDAGGWWRVRQRRQDRRIRSRVAGPGGQHYAPHAVHGLLVADVRRLHDAVQSYVPTIEARERHARLLDVLADAATHPTGLEDL